jgi:hypothetical protein
MRVIRMRAPHEHEPHETISIVSTVSPIISTSGFEAADLPAVGCVCDRLADDADGTVGSFRRRLALQVLQGIEWLGLMTGLSSSSPSDIRHRSMRRPIVRSRICRIFLTSRPAAHSCCHGPTLLPDLLQIHNAPELFCRPNRAFEPPVAIAPRC